MLPKIVLAIALVWFAMMPSTASAQVTHAMCVSGAKLAQKQHFSKALLHWRLVTTDASYKEWGRVSIECLRLTKIAVTPELAFQWMQGASDTGSTYAKTLLALMHANGFGTVRDLSKARTLLKESAKKGDEAAEYLVTLVDRIEQQDAELLTKSKSPTSK